MAHEILTVWDKEAIDPKTHIVEFHTLVVGPHGGDIWLSDMQGDGSTTVTVRGSSGIRLFDYYNNLEVASSATLDLAATSLLIVQGVGVSAKAGDQRLTLVFRDADEKMTWTADLSLTLVDLRLLADFNRDGVVDDVDSELSQEWQWGPEGRGAILLVNSDRDTAWSGRHFRDRLDRRVNGDLDLEDMTQVHVSFRGPRNLDLSGFTMRLHVSDAAASRVRAFDVSRAIPEMILGPGYPIAVLPPHFRTVPLALEGVDYPDSGFTGLLSLHLELESGGVSYGGDKVVLRVAPWLALPNTQPARRLYIAEMRDRSNEAAIHDISEAAKAAGVELVVVPEKNHRQDRWLQDEIEIGYAGRPGKRLAVVLDSPRNRGLDSFPEEMLLGPDFGYVTRGNDEMASSLDAFGNLDCTPPHTGPRGAFPFGRIVFGGAQPGARKGRRLMKVVSDFVYAQQVQYPIELYSDWLNVGHVDEFMSFVPANDRQGFRLLLASPSVCYALLSELQLDGHGALRMLEGKRFDRTVDDLLGDAELRQANRAFQQIIDWNRGVLAQEMGLEAADILHVPALFYASGKDGYASAYFPDMVNLQVLGKHLAIPKPFGPQHEGICIFERHMKAILEPLGLVVHFIDTYQGYHLNGGEIHCGTNVVREPFTRDWWTFDPDVKGAPVPRLSRRSTSSPQS